MTALVQFPTPVHPVDRLGEIRAQIAELRSVEAAIVEQVKDLGLGAHEGAYFRAAVSEVAPSSSLDVHAAEAKLRELGVDGRWFAHHQRQRAGSVSVRVSSRKGA